MEGTLIKGAEGKWGEWTVENVCTYPNGLAGFELRQEESKGGGLKDDTAANDIHFFCESGIMIATSLGKNMPNWGKWSERKYCPDNYLICGLRVQIEKPQGGGLGNNDDTALNNVDFECCYYEPWFSR